MKMRWNTWIVTAALAASVVFAQDAPAPPPPPAASATAQMETAVIPVKTLNGDSFNRLVRLLGVFHGANLSGDDKLRTIVVYAPKAQIAQIRQVIDQLDRPGSEAAVGRNIEMTLSFLLCSVRPPAQASPLPADLEPVAKQLRAATQYKEIQLLDVVPLRLQEGKQTQENWRIPGSLQGSNYPDANIQVTPENVGRKDAGRFVRISDLRISLSLPVTNVNQRQNLNTGGDFLEGQKTVLGKMSGTEEGTAIFVVVEVKVLD